jgi:hypothetical protein
MSQFFNVVIREHSSDTWLTNGPLGIFQDHTYQVITVVPDWMLKSQRSMLLESLRQAYPESRYDFFVWFEEA